MSAISRTQAWCKLAVLIADGLPAPLIVSLHEDDPILAMTVQTEADLTAWVAHFDHGLVSPRRVAANDLQWICSGYGSWHGWDVQVAAYPPIVAEPEPEPITEDLTSVREIAGTPEPYRCTGCHKTSRIIAHRPGCPVEAAWDAERAGAVSE